MNVFICEEIVCKNAGRASCMTEHLVNSLAGMFILGEVITSTNLMLS